MKKYKPLIFIFFLSLAFSCSHQQKAHDDSIVSIQLIDRNGFAETISTRDRLTKYQNTDFLTSQPYQKVLRVYGKNIEGKSPSKITSYHSNGHIWQYLEIMDGRAHGSYKEWFPNGQLKMQLQVIEGPADISEMAQNTWVFEGKNCIWDQDGHLEAEIFYERGLLHGDSLYYFPTGEVKKQISYFRDLAHGREVTYDRQGNELEVILYQEGLKNGQAKGYWQMGEPMYEELYAEDLLQEGSYFSLDGQLLSSVKEGYGYQAQFKDGILQTLIEYRKGLPEGKVEIFDGRGFTKIIYEQREGKKQGEEIEYYSKTNPKDPLRPKISLMWQEDMLQGPVKTWFPDGTQESQKEFYQNKKNGLSFAWYKNGAIMLVEEYEKDILTTGTYYKKGDKNPVSKIEKGKGLATLYDSDGYFLKKISYERGLPLLENESIH